MKQLKNIRLTSQKRNIKINFHHHKAQLIIKIDLKFNCPFLDNYSLQIFIVDVELSNVNDKSPE
jgi:hypothetical protein